MLSNGIVHCWPNYVVSQVKEFQARACNALAFRAVARWATHRHGERRPAPAASAHGGTYSHVAVAGGARGEERGAAAATTAAALRRRRATPTRGSITRPRSAPAHDRRGSRHGARAGG